MQTSKTRSTTTAFNTTLSQPRQDKPVDAAAEAGIPKVSFYQTDKWLVGGQREKTYVAPKNTLPEPLSKVFVKSSKPDPVTEELVYDRKKFTIDEYPDFYDPTGKNARVTIWSHEISSSVADIEFDKNTFVVRLFKQPETSVFPFTKDEFLKVIDVAKWQLELYCLPKNYSESDSE